MKSGVHRKGKCEENEREQRKKIATERDIAKESKHV